VEYLLLDQDDVGLPDRARDQRLALSH